MAPVECPTCGHENASSMDDPVQWCERCKSAVTPPEPAVEVTQLDLALADGGDE